MEAPVQACFDGSDFHAGIMIEFVQDAGPEIPFEALLVRACLKFLSGIVAKVGLEDTRSTHRKKVFVDDRVELNVALLDQIVQIRAGNAPGGVSRSRE